MTESIEATSGGADTTPERVPFEGLTVGDYIRASFVRDETVSDRLGGNERDHVVGEVVATTEADHGDFTRVVSVEAKGDASDVRINYNGSVWRTDDKRSIGRRVSLWQLSDDAVSTGGVGADV